MSPPPLEAQDIKEFYSAEATLARADITGASAAFHQAQALNGADAQAVMAPPEQTGGNAAGATDAVDSLIDHAHSQVSLPCCLKSIPQR